MEGIVIAIILVLGVGFVSLIGALVMLFYKQMKVNQDTTQKLTTLIVEAVDVLNTNSDSFKELEMHMAQNDKDHEMLNKKNYAKSLDLENEEEEAMFDPHKHEATQEEKEV